MDRTIEKLWTEYLSDECYAIETSEERKLTKKALKLHERVNALLNCEQQELLEKYVEAVYDAEALFFEKTFLKACKFAVTFILEAIR